MSKFTEILQGLRDRRAAATKQLNDVQKLLEMLNELIGTLEKIENSAPRELLDSLASGVEARMFKPGSPATASSAPHELLTAVRQILMESKRPMKRGELVSELLKRGLQVEGVDKNKNLGTLLWRNRNQFVHLKKLGYWPADLELEQIYSPELGDERPDAKSDDLESGPDEDDD